MTTSASPPSAPLGAPQRISHQPFSDSEFPWIFSFPVPESGEEFATAISLSPDKSLPPKTYSIPIPQRFQGHTAICSNFHCLMVENTDYESQDPDTLGIYLVNPFDSWTQLGRLPSSSTLSADPDDIDGGAVVKIAMNSSVALAVWSFGSKLAYTRLGIDRVWMDMEGILAGYRCQDVGYRCQDVVTYKDGLLCALDSMARKVFAFDFSYPTFRLIDLTLNLPAYQESDDGWTCFQQAQLVSSSSELFLVRWRNFIKKKNKKRSEVDVYKLMDDDDAEKHWVPIKCIGNLGATAFTSPRRSS